MIHRQPLVSIIITNYNHGEFIRDAIDSALSQTYRNIEVIVVDDGSTDNSRRCVEAYPSVRYYFQENQGLSAARNTGIDLAGGEYILFLDADDWLYPAAVNTNLNLMLDNSDAVFACGAHDMVDQNGKMIFESYPEYKTDVYGHLLLRNYLAMHAAVLFRKKVVEAFRYDQNLRACEDYDLYLRITRKLPVIIHDIKIAAYRRHSSNMSLNAPLMLDSVLKVLDRQKPSLANDREAQLWREGRYKWIRYYLGLLYREKLKTKGIAGLHKNERAMIFRHLKTFTEIWLRELVSGTH